MKTLPWWTCGLIGALGLSISTLIKAFYEIPRILKGGGTWSEFLTTVGAVFGMGFLCGILVWISLGLAKRFGTIGDTLVGVITMLFFFGLCMLIFDQSLLIPDPTKGLPMFLLAIPLGGLLGFLTGRDLRAFMANQTTKAQVQERSATGETK
jgi:hypothetical protein